MAADNCTVDREAQGRSSNENCLSHIRAAAAVAEGVTGKVVYGGNNILTEEGVNNEAPAVMEGRRNGHSAVKDALMVVQGMSWLSSMSSHLVLPLAT